MTVNRKKKLLSDIYYGHSGKHLTAYIPNFGGDIKKLKKHLDKTIRNTEKLLSKEQSKEFIQKFLQPVRRLLKEPSLLLKNSNNGWALLRTPKSFRIKKIATDLPSLNVVSDSFHIKPILKMAQTQKSCYVLSVNEFEATLYKADHGQLTYINSLRLVKEAFEKKKQFGKDKIFHLHLKMSAVDWLDDWVSESIEDFSKPLILAGKREFLSVFRSTSRYPYISKEFIDGSFGQTNRNELRRKTNKLLNEIEGRDLDKAKKALVQAMYEGDAEFEINKVAKLAVKDKVQRLYVAEDVYYWGFLDAQTGDISLHSKQRNCRDDDVLDDLAEIVLRTGKDVVLLPQSQMPHNSAVAAIVKAPSSKPVFTSVGSKLRAG